MGAVEPGIQGYSVAVSADGNTAIVGGYADNSSVGAAWVWTRSNGMWAQQGPKLIGSDAVSPSRQGISVALSADGNTALVGGPYDDNSIGAVWVWTRSGGVWSQQGAKLLGTGAVGAAEQGESVALSADGNTAIVGGQGDGNLGAAWVWTRSGGVWSQQGAKLVGTGTGPYGFFSLQGCSVSISADGNTAIVGGYRDNEFTGAAWVWTRTGGVWTQQGSKLLAADAVTPSGQGRSVALSADGNTALVGGALDNYTIGAAWVWTRSGGVWTQQGPKLADAGAAASSQGSSVALSADGNTALVGGPFDQSSTGAAWVWTRSGGVWTEQVAKLVGAGAVGPARQGMSVALSADGRTAIAGGSADNNSVGAAWVFVGPSSPAMSLDTPGNNSTQVQPFILSGWAIDLSAMGGTGIDTVHVWAVPSVGPPQFVGIAAYGASRADVGALYGSSFTNSAFSLSVTSLAPGTYTIVAFAHSTVTGGFNQSRTTVVTLPTSLPQMSLDVPANGSTVLPGLTVAGWALDRSAPAGSGVDAVHVWAFPRTGAGFGAAVFLGVASLGLSRPDVGAVFGGQFDSSGYALQVSGLALGSYRIVAYAESTLTGTFNQSQFADVTVSDLPAMAFDTLGDGATGSSFLVGGWAIDRAAVSGTGVDAIHVWAVPVAGGNPLFLGVAAYGVSRPDVGGFYGSPFTNSGFGLTVTGLAPGTYLLVAYAHSTVSGTFNQWRVHLVTAE